MDCRCSNNGVVAVNEAVHAEWHRLILPLESGDAATLEDAYGRPSVPEWTYVDDQFVAARRKARTAG